MFCGSVWLFGGMVERATTTVPLAARRLEASRTEQEPENLTRRPRLKRSLEMWQLESPGFQRSPFPQAAARDRAHPLRSQPQESPSGALLERGRSRSRTQKRPIFSLGAGSHPTASGISQLGREQRVQRKEAEPVRNAAGP